MATTGHRHEAARVASIVLRASRLCAISIMVSALGIAPLDAATRTASFTVNASIINDCTIIAIPNLDFGTIGVQNIAYYGTSNLVVACTPGTAYSVSLDAGSVGGSTVAVRSLSGPGGTMTFNLYRDAGYTQIWGMTPGTDTAGGTGTGSNQSYTIYGRIYAMQTTKAPGTYTTTITATITY
ncbi:spore coat U domain-containing protein [Lysobacter sp. FW306-1B-D06B]|uniref:Csu type fimbrial protein n=1 Tax=Lysobacter sp. FW306-1B-D06B TaxID=3140250 RepID=UPI003140545F